MIQPRLFEELDEAYDRGYNGNVQSFDLWLTGLRIDAKMFNQRNICRLLYDNLALTADRTNELEILAEFVGFFSRHKQGHYHIPIIGVSGIGKSHLFLILTQFLATSEKNLTWKLIDAAEFSRVDDNFEQEQPYHKILDDLKTKIPKS